MGCIGVTQNWPCEGDGLPPVDSEASPSLQGARLRGPGVKKESWVKLPILGDDHQSFA